MCVCVCVCVCVLNVNPPTPQSLTTQDLVFMAGQISRGMYHLTKKGLTHRDLAARNI